MDIGTYADGRTVSYNEASHEFSIEGIRTTAELLVRYDGAGQIAWASEPLRAWVHEFARAGAAPAQVAGAPAGSYQAAPAVGYDAAPAYTLGAPGGVDPNAPTTGYGVPQPAYVAPEPEWALGAAARANAGGAPSQGYPAPAYGAVSAPSAPGADPSWNGGVTNASAAFGSAVSSYDGGASQPIPSIARLSIADDLVTPASTNVVGRRYLAFAVDMFILWIGLIASSIFVGIMLALSSRGDASALDRLQQPIQALSYVVFFVYFVGSEAYFGTTLGKKMFGLRVLSADGGRVTLLQAFLRNLILFIDTLFFTLPALISMNRSKLHQRIGDRGAKTVVVRTL